MTAVSDGAGIGRCICSLHIWIAAVLAQVESKMHRISLRNAGSESGASGGDG
jgi:hypothetical protein